MADEVLDSDGYNSGYDSALIWSDDPEDAYFRSMQQAGAIESDSVMGDSTLAGMMDAPTIKNSEPRDEFGDGLSWGAPSDQYGDKRSRLGGAIGGVQPQGQVGHNTSESSLSYVVPSQHDGRSTTDSMGFSIAGSRNSSNTSQSISTRKSLMDPDVQSTTDSLGFSHSSGLANPATTGTLTSSQHTGSTRSSDTTGIKLNGHVYPDSIGLGNLGKGQNLKSTTDSRGVPGSHQSKSTNLPYFGKIDASQHSTTDSLGLSRTSDLTGISSKGTTYSVVPRSVTEQDTQSTAESSLGMSMSHHTKHVAAGGAMSSYEPELSSSADSLGFGGASTISASQTSRKPVLVDPNRGIEPDVRSAADSYGHSRSTGTVYTTTDATVASFDHDLTSTTDSYGFNRTRTMPAAKSDDVDTVNETPVIANRPPMEQTDVTSRTTDSYGFSRSRTVPVSQPNDSAAPTPVIANRRPMEPADVMSTTDSYGFTAASGMEHSLRSTSIASTMQGSHLQRPGPERSVPGPSADKENSKRSEMSDSYGFVKSDTMPTSNKSNESPRKSRSPGTSGGQWSSLLAQSYQNSMPDAIVETPIPEIPTKDTPAADHRETIAGPPPGGRPPISPLRRSPSNGSKMSDSYGFSQRPSPPNHNSPPRQIITTNDHEQNSNISNLAVASGLGATYGLVRTGTVQQEDKTSPDREENITRTRNMSQDDSNDFIAPWPPNAENSVMASTLSNPSAVKSRDLAGKANADEAAGGEKPPPPGFIYLCGGNPAQDPESGDKSPEAARERRNNRLLFLKLALVILVVAVAAAIAMLILIMQESDKQDDASLRANISPTTSPVTFPPVWNPTAAPSVFPSMVPTMEFVPPTISSSPTRFTRDPTAAPTRGPPTTARPTIRRTPAPTTSPTQNPTRQPTPQPTPGPTPPPTPPPTPGPTRPPTPPPTRAPVLQTPAPVLQTSAPTTNGALLSATRSRLIVGTPQSGVSLADTASPQFRALDWMVQNDASIASLSDADLLQRWTAVTTYYSFGGETWANSNFWMSNFSECGWNGITCNVDGRITGIVLSSNNLQGSIPLEISLASKLVDLRLDNNNIQGGLPPKLGLLTNLRSLKLNGNQISGSLPTQLGSLSRLTELALNANDLTGRIPSDFAGLAAIERLDLSYNRLNGDVPASIESLLALTSLKLERNSVVGNLPTDFCARSPRVQLAADCEEVSCPCCTDCCVDNVGCIGILEMPSAQPSTVNENTNFASLNPTNIQTGNPISVPATPAPTAMPLTSAPTAAPVSSSPTAAPTTSAPTAAPVTPSPTVAPVTSAPTVAPVTPAPTVTPVTPAPTAAPITSAPTVSPVTAAPTVAPVTPAPTAAPITPAPTVAPVTPAPTVAPLTPAPTVAPVTPAPTVAPITPAPTVTPVTPAPTVAPITPAPTVAPVTPAPTVMAPATPAPTAAPVIAVPTVTPPSL